MEDPAEAEVDAATDSARAVRQRAITAIDRINADDPNRFGGEPLALAEGRIAHGWVQRLSPGAGDALVLAARAHHLRRWELPRSSYPDGRAGYLRWRRDQKARHAADLSTLLAEVGVAEAEAERAAQIVQKLGLGTDPEVQVFEDAVALTFLETQFETTVAKVADEDKMVRVIAKTLAKMSPQARAVALEVDLDERLASLVQRALT